MVTLRGMILFALSVLSYNSQAQSLGVEGRVIEQIFVHGQLTETREFQFSAQVNGCSSLISTTNSQTHQRMQVTFENGWLYSLLSDPYPRTNFQQVVVVSDVVPEPAHSGRITPSDLPDDFSNCVAELWLAYASACYFQQQLNDQIRPIYPLDDPNLRREGFTLHGEWTLDDSAPFLPQKVSYFTDGIFRTFTNGKREVFRAPPPFDKGYAQAVYLRKASTNVNGFSIPSQFLFERYAINRGKLVPRVTVEGTLESARATPTPRILRPAFSGKASIADHRFENSNPPVAVLYYSATNGYWPEPRELTTNYLRAAQMERIRTKLPK